LEFLPKQIQAYAEAHTEAESQLLAQLARHTNAHVLQPRMLSGHLQGRLLAMISHILQPQLIVEIGTYTGYSALCLAEGLAAEGRLISIEANEELAKNIRHYFAQSPQASQLELCIGQAAQIIPNLPNQIDLAFIDADKKSNQLYYNLLLPKMRKGGIILADNVLWSGKVAQTDKIDKATRSLMDFNDSVQSDHRVQNVLLPLRDGLLMCRKL
jgi:caffeoyl-CoA O-methyltransferase